MSGLIKKTVMMAAVLALVACDNSTINNGEITSSSADNSNASSGASSSDGGFSLIKKPFDYQDLLINYADNIILPTYQNFELTLSKLSADVDAHCKALAMGNALEEASVQQDWREAMATWQRAELMWVGPVAESNNSLRNRIYSFATTAKADACAIDIATIEHNQESLALAGRANTVRGLDALEYLFFESTLNTACSSVISQTALWNTLPKSTRQLQRCEFAQAVVSDVLDNSHSLSTAWATNGDNYRSLFINPNNAGPHLKALSDAIFYLEKEVKDTKLGIPLGQTDACVLEACPKAVEAEYARNNGELILQNIKTFKIMFNGIAINGENGAGFDDIITYEGYEEVNVALNKKIDAAIGMAEQLVEPGLFVEQADAQLINKTQEQCRVDSMNAENGESVEASYCALHGLVQAINLQMRTDFVTIVNVDLPVRAQSDND